MTRVPDGILKDLFESVPDEKLTQLAEEHAASMCETFTLSVFGEITRSSVIAGLKTIALFEGIEYDEVVRAGMTTITLTHSLGSKYSTFESQILKSLFEMIGVRPRVRANKDSVSLEFGPPIESSGSRLSSQQYATKNTS
jgi:hypothetical protein